MLYTLILLAGLVFLTIKCVGHVRSFKRNLATAKATGLPVVCLLISTNPISWIMLLTPVYDRLPKRCRESGICLFFFSRLWHNAYSFHERIGSDTVIAVAPQGNRIWTCDPQLVNAALVRRHDFPKMLGPIFGPISIYGPTIISAHDREHRVFRRLGAEGFNDSTYRTAWEQTLKLLEQQFSRYNGRNQPGVIDHLGKDTGEVTLHAISTATFGRGLDQIETDSEMKGGNATHALSYKETMGSIAYHIFPIYMIPSWLLNRLPFEFARKSSTCYREWGSYMMELRNQAKEKVQRPDYSHEKANIVDALVSAESPTSTMAVSDEGKISSSAVFGNIFLYLFAGQETSAHTLQNAVALLATKPQYQQTFQHDLDRLLGDRAPSSWTYDNEFPRLMDSYAGAIMNETLRVYPAAAAVFKATAASSTDVQLNGKNVKLPANTPLFLNMAAAHRHPKYWPEAVPEPDSGEGAPYAVSAWNPELWLKRQPSDSSAAEDNEPLGLVKPTPGTWFPFSEGVRGCQGRKFAEVEVMMFLARLFKEFSIELNTPKYEWLHTMTTEERRKEWSNARREAERKLTTGVDFTMTIHMLEDVSLRLVPRGKERWIGI